MKTYQQRTYHIKFDSPAECIRNNTNLNEKIFGESMPKDQGFIKIQHRDIKFSNKLPNAFRVYRGKHS